MLPYTYGLVVFIKLFLSSLSANIRVFEEKIRTKKNERNKSQIERTPYTHWSPFIPPDKMYVLHPSPNVTCKCRQCWLGEKYH